MEEGRLYHVDTRLRPSGEQGLLVTSWDAFERYHHEDAADWERAALLRARVVYTNEDASGAGAKRARRSRRDRLRPAARGRNALPRGPAAESARGSRPSAGACRPGRGTSRFDPGGIMDVEFLVALGQLAERRRRRRADDDDRARRWRAWWRSAGPPSLLDDYAALRRVDAAPAPAARSPGGRRVAPRSPDAGPQPVDDPRRPRRRPGRPPVERPRPVRRPLRLSSPKTTAWRNRRRGSRRRPSRS